MRKWTYLVAMLMLAGATTTFTGCIDTDEPAGIEELRGAKAELLRAKVAVEAATAAQKQADAALTLAQAKTEEAKAAYEQARAKQQEEIAKQEALRTELQAAQNEAEKARIEAEIAEAAKRKADAENNMAEAAKQHEIAMKELEASLLAAQQAVVEAEKNLKLAEATMTPAQKAAIVELETELYGWDQYEVVGENIMIPVILDKWFNQQTGEWEYLKDWQYHEAEVVTIHHDGLVDKLAAAEDALFSAQKDLYFAMLRKEAGNEVATGEYKVKVAEYEVAAAKKAAEEVAELAKNDASADWTKEVEELTAKMNAISIDSAELAIEIEKLHADNKLAWDSVQIALAAFNDATDGLVGKTYKIPAYENNTLDSFPEVQALLAPITTYAYGENDYTFQLEAVNGAMSNDYNGAFAYLDSYTYDSIAVAATSVLPNFEGWINNLQAKIDARDDNYLINDSILQAQTPWDENIAVADSTFKADSLEWEVLVAAMKGTKTEPTDVIADLKKVTDAYNAEYAKTTTVMNAYNAAIKNIETVEKTVAGDAAAAKLAELEAAAKLAIYMDSLETKAVWEYTLHNLSLYGAWNSLPADKQTKAQLDAWLSAAAKTKVQAKADSIWNKDFTATSKNYLDLKAAAEAVKTTAIAKDLYKDGDSTKGENANSKIRKAYKEFTDARQAIYDLNGKLDSIATVLLGDATVDGAYKVFTDTIAKNYGLKVASDKTFDATTLKLAHFDAALKKTSDATKDSTYTMQATQLYNGTLFYNKVDTDKSTDISAAEFTEMTTTELLAYNDLKTKWENKSSELWGENDRMLPLAEEDIDLDTNTGSYAALLNAIKDKEEMLAGLDANKILQRLIDELTAQKAVVEAQIAAAIVDADAAYQTYATKHASYVALFNDINEKIAEAEHMYASYERVKNQLEGIISAYFTKMNYSFNYMKNSITYTVKYVYGGTAGISGNTITVTNLADFFEQWTLAEEANILDKETELKEAQVWLQMIKDGKFDAVACETRKVEKAQAAYDAIKAEFDAVLAQLNALIASFAE